MFYTFVVYLIKFILRIFNGKMNVVGVENLPKDEKFVLVAPHHSILDPVYLLVAAYPHRFAAMAKKELFEVPVLGWILRKLKMIRVDRESPGLSVIKLPVNYLKKDELNVLIFPSGSRFSEDLKGGAVQVARMANVNIVPAVYDGPLTIKEVFKRKKASVEFGEPIVIERKLEGVDDIKQHYSQMIQESFDQISNNLK